MATNSTEVANWLIARAPQHLLDSREWFYWAGPDSMPTAHVLNGCSHAELEWFDGNRDNPPIKMRQPVEGIALCQSCVLRLLKD